MEASAAEVRKTTALARKALSAGDAARALRLAKRAAALLADSEDDDVSALIRTCEAEVQRNSNAGAAREKSGRRSPSPSAASARTAQAANSPPKQEAGVPRGGKEEENRNGDGGPSESASNMRFRPRPERVRPNEDDSTSSKSKEGSSTSGENGGPSGFSSARSGGGGGGASAASNAAEPSRPAAAPRPSPKDAIRRVMALPNEDYYGLLGISRDASEGEIKKAYRTLALQLHPDKTSEPGAADAFKKVSRAASVLSDPKKRQMFDLSGRDPEGSGGAGHAGHPFGRGGGANVFHSFSGEDIDPEQVFRMFFGHDFDLRRARHSAPFRAARRSAVPPEDSIPPLTISFDWRKVAIGLVALFGFGVTIGGLLLAAAVLNVIIFGVITLVRRFVNN